jgi:hypothetical protein
MFYRLVIDSDHFQLDESVNVEALKESITVAARAGGAFVAIVSPDDRETDVFITPSTTVRLHIVPDSAPGHDADRDGPTGDEDAVTWDEYDQIADDY